MHVHLHLHPRESTCMCKSKVKDGNKRQLLDDKDEDQEPISYRRTFDHERAGFA